MGRSVTFSELREAVRVRADLPTFSASTYITTTAVNTMINASLSAFYGMLMEAYGDGYFAASSTLTTTQNVGTTSLPSRCVKLLKLTWSRGTDDMVDIKRGSIDDLVLANYAAKAWTEYLPRYRLQGASSIQWLPKPNAAYTVYCDYVEQPADLSADDDSFEAGPGWEEWVISDVARKIAVREEKDPSVHMAERADAEARIRSQAPDRDEGQPLTLRDAYQTNNVSDYELRNLLSQRGY